MAGTAPCTYSASWAMAEGDSTRFGHRIVSLSPRTYLPQKNPLLCGAKRASHLESGHHRRMENHTPAVSGGPPIYQLARYGEVLVLFTTTASTSLPDARHHRTKSHRRSSSLLQQTSAVRNDNGTRAVRRAEHAHHIKDSDLKGLHLELSTPSQYTNRVYQLVTSPRLTLG